MLEDCAATSCTIWSTTTFTMARQREARICTAWRRTTSNTTLSTRDQVITTKLWLTFTVWVCFSLILFMIYLTLSLSLQVLESPPRSGTTHSTPSSLMRNFNTETAHGTYHPPSLETSLDAITTLMPVFQSLPPWLPHHRRRRTRGLLQLINLFTLYTYQPAYWLQPATQCFLMPGHVCPPVCCSFCSIFYNQIDIYYCYAHVRHLQYNVHLGCKTWKEGDTHEQTISANVHV